MGNRSVQVVSKALSGMVAGLGTALLGSAVLQGGQIISRAGFVG